jgi:sulfite dehydrogenase (quinone) subunit SoeC
MNPAYSVILFTTASGAGYGLMALLALVGINHGTASSLPFALTTWGIALALIIVGLLSSTLHLGRPERAWRAFSQWRTSWLSREGIAAVAAFPVFGLFAMLWSGLIDRPQFIAPAATLTILFCIVIVFCTGMIYRSLKTIRAWNNALTVPVYLAFALATGALLLMAIATVFDRFQVFQAFLALISICALIILKLAYWRSIDTEARTHTMAAATGLGQGAGESVRQWEVPHTATNFIMKEMGYIVARRHAKKLRMGVILLLALALLLAACCFISPWFSLPSLIAAAIAAWMERWLFFAEAEHVVGLFYGNERA